jgi:tRNA(fMet)-specific endonuclease VapC
MTPVVVDTDVVSFLFKDDSRASGYLPLLQGRKLLVSFMTEAELEHWIIVAHWGAGRIQRFRSYMDRFVAVPSSRDLIVHWAQVMAVSRSNGRRIEVADGWIAATAQLYGAIVVTNNPTDYAGVPGLEVRSIASNHGQS